MIEVLNIGGHAGWQKCCQHVMLILKDRQQCCQHSFDLYRQLPGNVVNTEIALSANLLTNSFKVFLRYRQHLLSTLLSTPVCLGLSVYLVEWRAYNDYIGVLFL